MGKWLDLAARLEAETGGCDVSDVSDDSPPNVTIVTNVIGPLPPAVSAGLSDLKAMAAPRIARPQLWPAIVADAFRLASDGWATQALALGWSPLDLFGAVTDPAGDPFADGLAVKLGGRRVLALCASFATVADDGGGRSYLYRGNNEGARLLWVLDRGR